MTQQPRHQTALVTGGAKRLGAFLVEDLIDAGFRVAIHAHRSVHEAQTLAARMREKGGRVDVFQADLTDEAETAGLIGAVRDQMGPVDLLINNASIFNNDGAESFNSENFATHFAVHVKAPLILADHLAKQLPDLSEALIVNIIDQRVWALSPGFFTYTLSKSTLWTATQTMAQAFAPHIRVNAIGPGPTLKSSRQTHDDFQKQIDGLILKRGPNLAEFGQTIRYLYDTPSITGQMIALDGGQHLAWETPDVTGINE